MEYEQIRCTVADRIATISLDRPQARNGFTIGMSDELGHAITAAGADPQVRVIVLTGSGVDFCVGADLGSGDRFGQGGDEPGWVEPATRVARPVFESPKPVIAAVRGSAIGVGSTMILPADIRIAATDSRFGFVFARRGIYPEAGSLWFLPRLVGLARAQEWMVTGRLIGAEEALASGLVSALHDPDDVLPAALALAAEIIERCAPVSVAVIRQAITRMSALDSPYPAFELDAKLLASCLDNPDTMEGVMSFLERRTPRWQLDPAQDRPEFLPW